MLLGGSLLARTSFLVSHIATSKLVMQDPKLPCMLLGEKIAALMKARQWNFEAVAKRVRSHGAPNVRYQHIQQLVDIPGRHPRYISAMAKAFGFTVEGLERWRPGDDVPEVSESVTQATHTSQSVGIDAEILRLSIVLLHSVEDTLDEEYNLEVDATPLVAAYVYMRTRSERTVSSDNVVDMVKILRARETSNGREAGVGRSGGGTGVERATEKKPQKRRAG